MATTTPAAGNVRLGGVRFSVHDDGRPVANATCSLYRKLTAAPTKKGSTSGDTAGYFEYVDSATTGANGQGDFPPQPEGRYQVVCHHEPRPAPRPPYSVGQLRPA